MAPQEFADQIVQAGNIGALVADVRRNKALATVLEAANVTDQSGNEVDLSALATPEGQAELEQLDDAVADLDDFDDIEGSDDADEWASTDQTASTDQVASRDSE